MNYFSSFARLAALSLLGACAAVLPVHALDFSKERPVMVVGDGQVSVGPRSIKLPPGTWTFVAYGQGKYASSGGTSTTRHTGYFAQTSAPGVFRAGVVVEMGEIAFNSTKWLDEPCKAEANVHKTLLNSTVLFPECLMISRRATLHSSGTSSFYKQAGDWLAQQGVNQAAPNLDIMFMHYMATGQGLVRVFVPANAFASDQAAIEWANALPAIFRPLLQGRVDSATLPALP